MLLGAAKEELMESLLSCFFSGGVIYLLEELQGGFPGCISDQWHEVTLPSSPTMQSMEETELFWRRQ